jgi:hypothetical protein
MISTRHIILFVFLLSGVRFAYSQETVFALLKSDEQRANEYFKEKNFESALVYYSSVKKSKRIAPEIFLRIGESSYYLKRYRQAVNAFEEFLETSPQLPQGALFQIAESYLSLGERSKALECYRLYLKHYGDDVIIQRKIWRINNIEFLYEDSSHYAVRPLPINSREGDLFIQPFGKGYLFLSNRKEQRVVEKLDATTNKPFYGLYYSAITPDSMNWTHDKFARPAKYDKGMSLKFHAGPFAFYDNQKKIVITTSGKSLGLTFVEKQNNDWQVVSTFPFNSASYSITDPTITENGKIIYFSSDMPGGFGGKDLYRSEFIEGRWTKPENLGDAINTKYDEVAPFIFRNATLYFSSNGQAGFGGLDIYKSEILNNEFDEPRNLGYPLNSKLDDFGIFVDSTNQKGFFTSNRFKGEFNDDLFGFDMDLQAYPLVIGGTLRLKEHNWTDSSALQNFSNAKLFVIDAVRNNVVAEYKTDKDGKFEITIPYFSLYKIRVVGEDNHENFVALELPKHRKEHSAHDIVVIKDAFKTPDNPQEK